MTLAIFTDFDETITRVNVTDTLLERFAPPSWRAVQDDWLAGRINAREVLQRQMPLVAVNPRELRAFIDSVEVDPFFPDFVDFCRRRGHALYILSDGFDYWIRRILRRALSGIAAGPPLPVFACHLEPAATGVTISFPYFPEGCSHGCATCKPALFAALRATATTTVVIGDGRSDFLLSREADWVIAKGSLRLFCQGDHGLARPFEDFRDVLKTVRALEEQRGEAAPQ